ncbi:uncharacterized protein LOC125234633 isoform X2 [Leguminivora glycinivorella]|uniref:uncharacterized protein LOC125234633 isoform X2 n=1 Tax=Leguminivora glycinivorella TaxID=1035111 RepID=UPI00200DC052|nr:uncharacterized protein LOC125234633 isoform X2 [Leguminivora glycinivorella]
MPLKVQVTEQLLDDFLKLRCLLSFSGTEPQEFFSEDYVINDLAIVQLHIKDSPKTLFCKILARAKCGKVKVKVSCQDMGEPFYDEWICDNSWIQIGSRQNCDIHLDNVYTCLFHVNISASKVGESYLMRLYNDVYFTDFNLSAGDGSVAVHRAHLAAHSDVFQAMLTKDWKETNEGRIQIEGVSLKTLQHYKEFIYLHTLPDGDGLKSLLLLASYYLMDELKAECISKLALSCKSENWRELLEFATKNQLFELASAIMIVSPAVTTKDELNVPVKEKENDG